MLRREGKVRPNHPDEEERIQGKSMNRYEILFSVILVLF